MKKNIYLFITSILFFLILTEIGIRYLISIKKDFLFIQMIQRDICLIM